MKDAGVVDAEPGGAVDVLLHPEVGVSRAGVSVAHLVGDVPEVEEVVVPERLENSELHLVTRVRQDGLHGKERAVALFQRRRRAASNRDVGGVGLVCE